MSKTLCALMFIAVLSLSLLVGCSASGRDVNDRIDLIPQTANMVGHVELSQIVDDADIAEIYAALPKQAGDPQSLEDAIAKVIDMNCLDLRDFEEGWIFGDMSAFEDTNYFGAILKGSFDEGTALSCARSEYGEGLTSIDYQGHTIYTGPEQETGLASLSDDLLVAGSVSAVKDVIAVSEGSAPALDGDLLDAYDDLDGALINVAAVMTPGVVQLQMEELIDGTTSPPALDALYDVQAVSVALDKNGQSVACDSQLFFSNKESANEVKGWIPLLPLMIGGMDIPNGSVIQNPEDILALLPQILDNGDYDCRVAGSCLTISSDLTAADIEAMSNTGAPTGLSIEMAFDMGTLTSKGMNLSVDADISNHIGMKIDIDDLRVAAVSRSGQTYVEETVPGATIAANSTTEFSHEFVVPLELVNESGFLVTIDTEAKARGMSLPLNSSVELAIPDLDSLVVVPEIDLGVLIGELSPDGLNMRLQATVPNCNPFGIDVGDLEIVTKDEAGDEILKAVLSGNGSGLSIAPNSIGTLSGDLVMPLEVIGEPAIQITVQTEVGLAGNSLPIKANVAVSMPDIDGLVTVPEMELGVNFGELTADGLHMGLEATVPNSNPFGIDVGDLKILGKDQSGNEVFASTIDGCSIGANSIGTLSGDLVMPLGVVSEPAIEIMVQTQAGFAGLSMYISGKVVVGMPDVENLITVPEMDLGVDFGKLTSDGLYLELQAAIANSNPFAIDVDDLQIVAMNKSGHVILNSSIEGNRIEPDSTGTLAGEILLPLEVFDEATIAISVETQVGIGEASVPIGAQVTINMPQIESLVAFPKVKVWTKPSWECGLPLPSLHIETASTIANKADFDLEISDIQVSFFDSNDKLVHQMTIQGGTVAAHCSKKFCGSATLCASEYMSLICGGDFTVEVAAQGGISGVDAKFPVEAAMTTVVSSLLKLPEVDLGVDFGELTCDGLHLGLEAILDNPNPFGIDVEDLLVVCKGKSGNVLFTSNLNGLAVEPDSTGKLISDILIPLDVLDESKIVITIEGQAGFSGATLPINGKIAVKIPDIKNLVTLPEADLDVDFWELTPDGLHMGLQANLTNPNPFGIDVDDLLIVAKSRSGKTILSSSIEGCSIGPNSAGTLSGDLLMPLGVLERSTIVLKIQTEAGFAEIALPINAKMTIKMPGVEDLFAVPAISLGVGFGELTSDGLPVELRAKITNSNPFGIDVGNLKVVATKQSGGVIFTSILEGRRIESESTGQLSMDLMIPHEVLDEPSIVITVQTKAGFAEITLPVSEQIVLVNMPDVESITSAPDEESVTSTPDEESVASTPDEESVNSTPDEESVTSTPDEESVTSTPDEESVAGTPDE